jgi:hypothetical protein
VVVPCQHGLLPASLPLAGCGWTWYFLFSSGFLDFIRRFGIIYIISNLSKKKVKIFSDLVCPAGTQLGMTEPVYDDYVQVGFY